MGFISLAAFHMASFCFPDANLAITGRGGMFVVEPSGFVLCEGRGLPTRCDLSLLTPSMSSFSLIVVLTSRSVSSYVFSLSVSSLRPIIFTLFPRDIFSRYSCLSSRSSHRFSRLRQSSMLDSTNFSRSSRCSYLALVSSECFFWSSVSP